VLPSDQVMCVYMYCQATRTIHVPKREETQREGPVASYSTTRPVPEEVVLWDVYDNLSTLCVCTHHSISSGSVWQHEVDMFVPCYFGAL